MSPVVYLVYHDVAILTKGDASFLQKLCRWLYTCWNHTKELNIQFLEICLICSGSQPISNSSSICLCFLKDVDILSGQDINKIKFIIPPYEKQGWYTNSLEVWEFLLSTPLVYVIGDVICPRHIHRYLSFSATKTTPTADSTTAISTTSVCPK